jgi:hypothetical protein
MRISIDGRAGRARAVLVNGPERAVRLAGA